MFDWYQEAVYIFRILLSGVCGILVGLERKNRSKEAGIRTHFVVACGAALIMIISKYAFFDVISGEAFSGADIRLDPSRVASTIASGIGFLGAGMIFVQKNTVKGLTTAAGIWTTSGIGMAIGSGMYILGVSVTFIILIAQLILHLNFRRLRNTKTKLLTVKDVCEEGYQQYISDEFQKNKISIRETSIESSQDGEKRNYRFVIDVPSEINEEEIMMLTKYRSSIRNHTKNKDIEQSME